MKRICLLYFVLLCIGTVEAQLMVENGTLHVSENSYLYVDSDVFLSSGVITVNKGTIDLTGDLINNGTVASGAISKLVFSGVGIQHVMSGAAIFKNIDLKNSGGFLILLDNFNLENDIKFLDPQNWVILGDYNFSIGALGNSFLHDEQRFFVTNGNGLLVHQASTDKVHPVGYDNLNYLPALVATAGGTDAVAVRVIENAFADGPPGGEVITEGVVNASWDIYKASPGPSEMIIILGWQSFHETPGFDREACSLGWFDGISYDGHSLTGAQGSGPIYSQNRWSVSAESGRYIVGGKPALDYVLVSPRVFLHGPLNGVKMDDNLRQNFVLPLEEPHTDLGFIQNGIGGGEAVSSTTDFDLPGTDDDVVDWVFLELREYLDNDEIYMSTSGLLQRDGDIVSVDGGPMKMYGAHPGDYYLTVRHRNHLGIHSANKLSLDKTVSTIDFTNESTPTLGVNAQIDLGSGLYAMWSGDANRDGQINAVDRNGFWSTQNGNPFNYFLSSGDFNLDATINAVDKNDHWRISNSQISNYDY